MSDRLRSFLIVRGCPCRGMSAACCLRCTKPGIERLSHVVCMCVQTCEQRSKLVALGQMMLEARFHRCLHWSFICSHLPSLTPTNRDVRRRSLNKAGSVYRALSVTLANSAAPRGGLARYGDRGSASEFRSGSRCHAGPQCFSIASDQRPPDPAGACTPTPRRWFVGRGETWLV